MILRRYGGSLRHNVRLERKKSVGVVPLAVRVSHLIRGASDFLDLDLDARRCRKRYALRREYVRRWNGCSSVLQYRENRLNPVSLLIVKLREIAHGEDWPKTVPAKEARRVFPPLARRLISFSIDILRALRAT